MAVVLKGERVTRQTAVALVGVLVVASTVGWGAIGAAAGGAGPQSVIDDVTTDDGDGVIADDRADDESVERQNESDGNESVITSNQTIEAFRAVENRTNGTVFGARLGGEPRSDLDRSEFVYELDVLAENGSHLVAEVYAANATVASVESANDSDGVFADLFGSDDEVPDAARDTGELRSAADAVRLAVNETDTGNQTVTQVVLETRNDALVYRVQQFDPEGERLEVVVAATGDEDGVITTDP